MAKHKNHDAAMAKIEAGASQASVAREFKMSPNTINKWAQSYKQSNQPEDVPEEEQRPKRRKRTPLGQRDVLTYPGDDRYVQRVVVEDERRVGRVESFKDAGWEPVHAEGTLGDPSAANSRAPGSVVSRPVGLGGTGYLMRKLKEEEEEDLQYLDENAKKLEEGIFAELEDESRTGHITLGGRTETSK